MCARRADEEFQRATQPLQDRNAAALAAEQQRYQQALLQWQKAHDLAVVEWEHLRVKPPAACCVALFPLCTFTAGCLGLHQSHQVAWTLSSRYSMCMQPAVLPRACAQSTNTMPPAVVEWNVNVHGCCVECGCLHWLPSMLVIVSVRVPRSP